MFTEHSMSWSASPIISSRMLKRSLFSPARPWRAKTRLFPCGVLASLRGSTLSRNLSEVGNAGGVFPFTKIHCKGERPTQSAVRTPFASSLAAALLDGLFEHPARRGELLCRA